MATRSINLQPKTLLTTPAAPTVTPQGTTGATTYGYKIVKLGAATANQGGPIQAFGGRRTGIASAEGTTATGNAAITSVNFNRVTWINDPLATGYDIYRTTGGPNQGKIGTVGAGVVQFDDTGSNAILPADGTTAPAVDTTGVSDWFDTQGGGAFWSLIVTGVFVGTYKLEGSTDATLGINAAAAPYPVSTDTTAIGVNPLGPTSPFVRVRNTAFTSGTPTMMIHERSAG